jgi:cyclopropane fatty-acyl-phospholipid synthase-like methyltransferase
MATEEKEKIPLRLKLKAWWEGYDSDELRDAFLATLGDEEEGEASPPPAAPKKATKEKPKEEHGEKDAPIDPWNAERVNIAQYIWGEGFCGPGGPEHIVSMSKLLALSPKMSMMCLGAGLGGPTRTLADKFGVWVTGYEESEHLVETGNEMSIKAGMAKKADIHHFVADGSSEFDRNFDRVLAKEYLFQVREKKKLMQAVFQAMKADGLMLITDYVLGSEGAVSSDAYREWKDSEHGNVCPVTEDELKEMVEGVGFSVRVHEDISEQQISLIASAWAGADKAIADLVKEENGMELVDTLLNEAEFWARRSKLLSDGTLKLWRTLGYKKEEGKAMMSNW